MKMNKNKNIKISNKNINDGQSQARDGIESPNPNPNPNRNYGPFEFEINQDFIEENKKIKLNLVRPRQNNKQKICSVYAIPEKKEKNGSLQTPFRAWDASDENS